MNMQATFADVGGLRLLMQPVQSWSADCGKGRQTMMPDTGGEWEMLLVAANAGDGHAFLRFLTAITPVVRKVVQARGRALAPDQREDIVQEVLLAVHLKRQTWQAGMPVRPWLYAVCRHKVADAFRRRGTQVHLPIEDFEEALAGEEGPDPLAARDADALLSRLDGRSAEIVRALSLRGESAESVGARHAMSEGAVRVAFHRAMKRLVEIGRRMND